MEWPAQSSDLNPIENWGDIKNAVSEAKPKNSQELGNVSLFTLGWNTGF